MLNRETVLTIGFIVLGGCGGEPVLETNTITPRDFVLLPCHADVSAPCALAVAGGKRVLIGAPSGADMAFSDEELEQLDAVLVFSLRARDVEGLDRVRNRSWQAGRETPLLVVGPEGASDFADALNIAFETPDALHIVDEGIPAGGFDAALLRGADVPLSGDWVSAFDTGDLLIEARDMGNGHLHVQVRYQTMVELVGNCAAWQASQGEAAPTETPLGCDGSPASEWPLAAPIWYVRDEEGV